MDAIDPFLTFLEDSPDYNEGDYLTASTRLAERQTVISDWLQGKTTTEHVLETLIDQGLNPDDYVKHVTESIDFLLKGGVPFMTDESGLLLPAS
ncbi:MAG: hypothetical protein AAGD25_33795 [Cyanobacteria bacterium P01_F01_bin.150]